MMIETNITNHRKLATTLARDLNARAVCLGPPTFAYQTGDIHLSRERILSGDDLDGIFHFLEIQSIVAEEPKKIQGRRIVRHQTERDMPVDLGNLLITPYSKQRLIRKAFCMPALYIPERAVNSMPTGALDSAIQSFVGFENNWCGVVSFLTPIVVPFPFLV